ncbi:Uncharacterised protein [Neisseria dentiae]|nr:Uncharacterised protein [Neisseria dentiae]
MGILNGFIACRSDEILPEFEVKTKENSPQYPTHGSVIWAVEDGVKRKAAVYEFKDKRFVPYIEE